MDGEHRTCTSAPGILLVCPHAWDPRVAPRAQVPAVSMLLLGSAIWRCRALVLARAGDFLQVQGVWVIAILLIRRARWVDSRMDEGATSTSSRPSIHAGLAESTNR